MADILIEKGLRWLGSVKRIEKKRLQDSYCSESYLKDIETVATVEGRGKNMKRIEI